MPDLMYCSVKALIRRKDGRFLFIRMKSGLVSCGVEYYDLPGGRLSSGENPYHALIREVKEETGFEIKVGKPVGMCFFVRKDVGIQTTFTVFESTCKKPDNPANSSSDGIISFEWLTLPEAQKKVFPNGSFNALLKNYRPSFL